MPKSDRPALSPGRVAGARAVMVSRQPEYEMHQVAARRRTRVREVAGDACATWLVPGVMRAFRNVRDAEHAARRAR